jgi:hypothetical protein
LRYLCHHKNQFQVCMYMYTVRARYARKVPPDCTLQEDIGSAQLQTVYCTIPWCTCTVSKFGIEAVPSGGFVGFLGPSVLLFFDFVVLITIWPRL